MLILCGDINKAHPAVQFKVADADSGDYLFTTSQCEMCVIFSSWCVLSHYGDSKYVLQVCYMFVSFWP